MLVGLPVLGLLGVLQVGGLIEAPPAVGGWWAYTRTSGASECLPATGVFEVVQSGEYAVVSAPGRTSAPARLRRGVLRTEASEAADCAGPLSVEARVGQEIAERIKGTISGAPFVAVRTEAPRVAVAAAPGSSH